MRILLFIITWLFLLAILFEYRKTLFSVFFPGRSYSPLIAGSLILLFSHFAVSALILLQIEVLSSFSMLGTDALTISWALAALITLLISRRYLFRHLNAMLSYGWNRLRKISFLSAAALLYLIILGLIAFYSPPNGWDSMTYHLARTAHWADNGSIAHYPTHILRQLFQPPFCEYMILNFNLLTGSDRLSNLVQYIHFALSIPALCLVFYTLTGRISFWRIAVLFITIPMVILHSTSTQNDLSFGFWLLCSLFLVFSMIMEKRQTSLLHWVLIGFVSGTGFLVKGTSIFYLLPLAVFLLIACMRSFRPAMLPKALIALLIFLLIILPHSYRNYKTFGTPAGGTKEQVALYKNEVLRPNIAISNTIRNFSLHFSTPFTSLNAGIHQALEKFHTAVLRIDINDKRSTYIESSFSFGTVGLGFHEVSSSNFIHACLILLSLFFIRIIARNKMMLIYFIIVICGFVCFSLLLKWQHSYSRLHTPFFMAYVPVLFYLTDHFRIRFLSYLLLAAGIPWLLLNNLHPLVSHPDLGPLGAEKSIFSESQDMLRFKNREDVSSEYMSAYQRIRQFDPARVGIIMGDNDYDYLNWYYLRGFEGKTEYDHIDVNNESNKYSNVSAAPELILSTMDKGSGLTYAGRNYQLVQPGKTIFIYR